MFRSFPSCFLHLQKKFSAENCSDLTLFWHPDLQRLPCDIWGANPKNHRVEKTISIRSEKNLPCKWYTSSCLGWILAEKMIGLQKSQSNGNRTKRETCTKKDLKGGACLIRYCWWFRNSENKPHWDVKSMAYQNHRQAKLRELGGMTGRLGQRGTYPIPLNILVFFRTWVAKSWCFLHYSIQPRSRLS